jgi:hypothetical protein
MVDQPGHPARRNPTGDPAMTAYRIYVWCDFDGPESDLAMALEQGELWEKASDVQYQIEEVTRG